MEKRHYYNILAYILFFFFPCSLLPEERELAVLTAEHQLQLYGEGTKTVILSATPAACTTNFIM